VPDRGGAEAAAMTDRVCELFCGAGGMAAAVAGAIA